MRDNMARLAVLSSGSHALSLGRVRVKSIVFSKDAQERAQLHPPLRFSFRHAVPTVNSSNVHVRVIEASLLISDQVPSITNKRCGSVRATHLKSVNSLSWLIGKNTLARFTIPISTALSSTRVDTASTRQTSVCSNMASYYLL